VLTLRDLWRAIVLVALCAALVLLCAGCGGSADDCEAEGAQCADTRPLHCSARPERCL
jgi:hypothetical protein